MTRSSLTAGQPWPRIARWTVVIVASVWAMAAIILAGRPAVVDADVRGRYAVEGDRFRWTSSQTVIPITDSSRATLLTIAMASGRWPGRAPGRITLAVDGRPFGALIPDDRPRHYRILVPEASAALTIHTPVAWASAGDRRLLGVQVFGITGRSVGPPVHAMWIALAVALTCLPLALLMRWLAWRGWAIVAGITTLGLALRTYQLTELPAGFFQDEAVSLIDAWSLIHTGRDHLGNWLPLGAFESFGDWVSPLMTYCQLLPVLLFGPTPLAGRLVVALAGAIAILVGYATARALEFSWAGAVATALVSAVSPWQIMRSRVAGPPSAALLPWALCLLAALLVLRRGGRREALLFTLTAGLGVYAYPTLKLAIPLLVGLTLLLALAQDVAVSRDPASVAVQRWWNSFQGLAARWWPAGLLLIVLWLPLAQLTLLNPYSAMRTTQKLLRAESVADWTLQWFAAYSVYLSPAFYFVSGDASNGMPGQGVQLLAEAPLVLLGLATLGWRCLGRGGVSDAGRWGARLLLGALLIAPLPASLMTPNPHLSRALLVAPVYALLIGMGVAGLLQLGPQRATARWTKQLPVVLTVVLLAAIVIQGAQRFQGYMTDYPAVVARKYQDGLREAVEAAVRYAPDYDEVWVESRLSFPYVYVLAAQAMTPDEAQTTIVVNRPRTTFNTVTSVGKYRFANLRELPDDLPVVEALATSLGEPGYLLQQYDGQQMRILLVRRMAQR